MSSAYASSLTAHRSTYVQSAIMITLAGQGIVVSSDMNRYWYGWFRGCTWLSTGEGEGVSMGGRVSSLVEGLR